MVPAMEMVVAMVMALVKAMPIVLAWEAVKVELENRVPVVRCRDCKYWGNEETKVATVCEFPCVQLFCVCDALKRLRKAGNCMTNEDFFCAHGERKTDEQ